MASPSRGKRSFWYFPGVLFLVFATILFTLRAPDSNRDVPGDTNVERFLIQITQIQVRLMESIPVQVMADVNGIIPDACSSALEPEVTRSGNTITVRIIGERPRDLACAQVIRDYTRNISLGTFEPGDYTLNVNDATTSFHVD